MTEGLTNASQTDCGEAGCANARNNWGKQIYDFVGQVEDIRCWDLNLGGLEESVSLTNFFPRITGFVN